MTPNPIGFIPLPPDDSEDPESREVDMMLVQGQIQALFGIVSLFVDQAPPGLKDRVLREVRGALLSADSVLPLERHYGSEFLRGYRGIIDRFSDFLRE